jgi:hypothetical protein
MKGGHYSPNDRSIVYCNSAPYGISWRQPCITYDCISKATHSFKKIQTYQHPVIFFFGFCIELNHMLNYWRGPMNSLELYSCECAIQTSRNTWRVKYNTWVDTHTDFKFRDVAIRVVDWKKKKKKKKKPNRKYKPRLNGIGPNVKI